MEDATIAFANVCGWLAAMDAGYPVALAAQHCGVALPSRTWLAAYRDFCLSRGAKHKVIGGRYSFTRGVYCDVDMDAAIAHADAVEAGGGRLTSSSSSSAAAAVPEDAALLKLIAADVANKAKWAALRAQDGIARFHRNSQGKALLSAAQRARICEEFRSPCLGGLPLDAPAQMPWCGLGGVDDVDGLKVGTSVCTRTADVDGPKVGTSVCTRTADIIAILPRRRNSSEAISFLISSCRSTL